MNSLEVKSAPRHRYGFLCKRQIPGICRLIPGRILISTENPDFEIASI
jgi:hypothetical protein